MTRRCAKSPVARPRRSSRNSAKASRAAAGGGAGLRQGGAQARDPAPRPGVARGRSARRHGPGRARGRRRPAATSSGARFRASVVERLGDRPGGARRRLAPAPPPDAGGGGTGRRPRSGPGSDVELGLAAPRCPVAHDRSGRRGSRPGSPGRSARPGSAPRPAPLGRAPATRALRREPPLVGRLGEVVEASVELGQPEPARHDRRGLVLLRQKLPAERAERGQTLTSKQFHRGSETLGGQSLSSEVKARPRQLASTRLASQRAVRRRRASPSRGPTS